MSQLYLNYVLFMRQLAISANFEAQKKNERTILPHHIQAVLKVSFLLSVLFVCVLMVLSPQFNSIQWNRKPCKSSVDEPFPEACIFLVCVFLFRPCLIVAKKAEERKKKKENNI